MKVRRGPGKRLSRVAVQSETGARTSSAPLLPHEHDESPEVSGAEPEPTELQAHADVKHGLVDTERRQDATRIFNARRARRP